MTQDEIIRILTMLDTLSRQLDMLSRRIKTIASVSIATNAALKNILDFINAQHPQD